MQSRSACDWYFVGSGLAVMVGFAGHYGNREKLRQDSARTIEHVIGAWLGHDVPFLRFEFLFFVLPSCITPFQNFERILRGF